MKYAVFAYGGKQFRVSEGQELLMPRLPGNAGDLLTLDQVLLFVNEPERQIGRPFLPEVTLKAKIISHLKAEKIRVATYKAKSRYRKVKGHRQPLTKLLIEKIETRKTSAPLKNKARAKTNPK